MKEGPQLLFRKIQIFFYHTYNSSEMAKNIFLKFNTLEQLMKKLSLTFLNVYIILGIFGLFCIQNDQVEEIRTFSKI